MDVGVVLSGGGARCFAHIGVLRAFEERGFTPVAMSTCSASAIIGAFYAAGHSAARVHEIIKEANLARLLDINFDGGSGMIGHAGLAELLRPHLPETFEALSYPVAAVSVDIQEGRLYVFREGPLIPRLCASNAFPGIFDPVKEGERYYTDGGTLNIMPVDVIRTLTNAPVIAVDVTLPVGRRLDFRTPKADNLWNKVTARLSPKQLTLPLEMIEKAFTITQGRLTELLVAMHPPDLMIKPPLRDDFMPQDFGRLEEAVRCGYEAALRALEPSALPPLLRASERPAAVYKPA